MITPRVFVSGVNVLFLVDESGLRMGASDSGSTKRPTTM